MARSALTLVSYNVSFAAPSSVAPDRALRAKDAPRLIRDEVLRTRPDVVALQECPGESWAGSLLGRDGYASLGTSLASHARGGYVDLLARRDLVDGAARIALEHPAFPVPAAAAAIVLPDGTDVVVASIHLPHTAEKGNLRELMCEAIMQIASQRCSNVLLIGDFNMRAKEDSTVENLAGGGWADAWKATGQDKGRKFTWDSRTNLYHEPGPNSRFVARFDRCYVRGDKVTARTFDLIGNRPINGREGDYLSDHYGIVVKVDVRSSNPGNESNLPANLGIKVSAQEKYANGKSGNDVDMVDLTGDSDEDVHELKPASVIGKNDGLSVTNTTHATAGKSGWISKEEMRRLRLEKVEAASICVKAFGGPYEDSLVLATSTKAEPLHHNDNGWNDGCDSSDGGIQTNPSKKPEQENVKRENEPSEATFRDHSSSGSVPLSIVTWNISETHSNNPVSSAAPDAALRSRESARLIKEACYGPQQDIKPDIIALQECDAGWGTMVFRSDGYVSVGTERSHCGFVDLLVRRDFACERIRLSEGEIHLPSVAAIITLPNAAKVAVSSNHLEPFGNGDSTRARQCQLLMSSMSRDCENVLIVGDMNMRKKEDSAIEKLCGGGWIDAWKACGSAKNLTFTWDSFANRYHSEGFEFKSRFDRAYLRGRDLSVSNFGFIGNQPVNGTKGDYLSDHYGLSVTVNVAPHPGASDTRAEGVKQKAVSTSTLSSGSMFSQNGAYASSQSFASTNDNADVGSEDTVLRANGKRARSTTNAAESNSKRASKKESQVEEKAKKKRGRFDSSSSDGDYEEMRRKLAEKQGREFVPRGQLKLKRRRYNPSSSDDDDWGLTSRQK